MSNDLKRFASDPLTFIENLVIPSARGDRVFKSVMGDFQREWFKQIAPSLIAVSLGETPPITRFWNERTKGGSKDSDCACCLIWLLAFSPRKLDMQVGAADRDQANEVKKAVDDILRLNPFLSSRIAVQSWSVVCKSTGSECSILAADVAGSHGARPDIVLLNELSHVTKEEFAQNLLDNATKKPNGLVIVATNAGFLNTWQFEWRLMAHGSDRWNVHVLDRPAPWLSEAEVDEARKRNPEARFQRLFFGQWLSAIGQALDPEAIERAFALGRQQSFVPDGCYSYFMGVDIGVVSDFSSVVVVRAMKTAGHTLTPIELVHTETFKPSPGRPVDLQSVHNMVVALAKKYKVRATYYDKYQMELSAQQIQKLGVTNLTEFNFTGANLTRMASTILQGFSADQFRFYEHKALLQGLLNLKLEEKSYGYRLTSPRTPGQGHDDDVTAWCLAVMAAVDGIGKPLLRAGIMAQGMNGTFIDSMGNRKGPRERALERGMKELEANERYFNELSNRPRDNVADIAIEAFGEFMRTGRPQPGLTIIDHGVNW